MLYDCFVEALRFIEYKIKIQKLNYFLDSQKKVQSLGLGKRLSAQYLLYKQEDLQFESAEPCKSQVGWRAYVTHKPGESEMLWRFPGIH